MVAILIQNYFIKFSLRSLRNLNLTWCNPRKVFELLDNNGRLCFLKHIWLVSSMDGGIFSHWWFACIWGNLDIKHTTLESFLQWKRIRHEDMVSNAFAGHTYHICFNSTQDRNQRCTEVFNRRKSGIPEDTLEKSPDARWTGFQETRCGPSADVDP